MSSDFLSLRSMTMRAHSQETYRWDLGTPKDSDEYVVEAARQVIVDCYTPELPATH